MRLQENGEVWVSWFVGYFIRIISSVGYHPKYSERWGVGTTLRILSTLFDVVTCCPTHHNSSTNLCRNAAAMPGKAAGDGELYKRKKWLHHCQAMDLLFVPLAHENGGRMGEAARKFLDRLVLRVGGKASERARYRCYTEK